MRNFLFLKVLPSVIAGLLISSIVFAVVILPPSMQRGDILVATSTVLFYRLATGTEGQVLKISSGIPAWGTIASGGSTSTDWIISGTLMYSTTTVKSVSIGTTTQAGMFQVATNTTIGLVVDTAGKVGIGTTTPGYALHLVNPAGINANLGTQFQNDQPNMYTYLNFAANRTNDSTVGVFQFINNAAADNEVVSSFGSDREGANDAATLYFSTQNAGGNLAERMRITSAGNVGIGTSSPAYLLDVYGNARLGTSSVSNLFFRGLSNFNSNFYIDTLGNVATGTWAGTKFTPENLSYANATTDEQYLTYEATGNTFEWAASPGGVTGTSTAGLVISGNNIGLDLGTSTSGITLTNKNLLGLDSFVVKYTDATTTLYERGYALDVTLDALNGLIKGNGAGGYSAVTDSSANWNTAFGWGNHASAGYLTALASSTAGITISGNSIGLDLATSTAGITITSANRLGLALATSTARISIANNQLGLEKLGTEFLVYANATTDEYVLAYDSTGNAFKWVSAAGVNSTSTAGLTISGANIGLDLTTSTAGIAIANANRLSLDLTTSTAGILITSNNQLGLGLATSTAGIKITNNQIGLELGTSTAGVSVSNNLVGLNMLAGRSLTLTGGTLDADAELYTKKVSFGFEKATTTEAFRYRYWWPSGPVTIVELGCQTESGTVVIDSGEVSATGLATTSALAALTCDTDVASSTTFGDAAIADMNKVMIKVMSISNATTVHGYIKYTQDD